MHYYDYDHYYYDYDYDYYYYYYCTGFTNVRESSWWCCYTTVYQCHQKMKTSLLEDVELAVFRPIPKSHLAGIMWVIAFLVMLLWMWACCACCLEKPKERNKFGQMEATTWF